MAGGVTRRAPPRACGYGYGGSGGGGGGGYPGGSYTEVEYHRGRKPSMSGSLIGSVVGLFLLAGATALLWTNEGSAVAAQYGLLEAERHHAAGTGGVAHLSGELRGRGDGMLRDDAFDVHAAAIWLERVAEVYLWKEHAHESRRKVPDGRGGTMTETVKTYSYREQWSSREVRSAEFRDPRAPANPSFDEALRDAGPGFSNERWSQPVTLHGLQLARGLLQQAGDGERLGHSVYAPGCEGGRPAIGCARLSWKHAPLGEVSVLARRARDGLEPWVASSGFELAMLRRGQHTPAAMFAAAAGANAAWKWGMRALGGALVWAGWGLVLGPFSYLASWVPLLGGLVGCAVGLLALSLAAAQTLVVVALAWLWYRPLLSATLLALAAASLFLGYGSLRSLRRGGARAAAASAPRPAASAASAAAAAATARATGDSPASVQVGDRLAQLKSMLDRGLITQADYDAKKEELLSRM